MLTPSLQKSFSFLLVGAAAIAQPTSCAESADYIDVANTRVAIRWRGPMADVSRSGIVEWIARSANIVARYYGMFPVRAVAIAVTTTDGESMGSGRTFGHGDPHIEVTVGQHVSAQTLLADWVLIHEMIHLSLPEVADEYSWFAEGVATYVEGVARVQAGNMREAELWEEYFKAMPRGLPQPNDRGLDNTHTWARTYWGGALYCLFADARIREQTHNRRGLQDALRAIARAGGAMATEWPLQRILTTGDAATHTTVLTDLYLMMRDRPVAPDLSKLWIDLGISMSDGAVQLDNSARLADARRAITMRAK